MRRERAAVQSRPVGSATPSYDDARHGGGDVEQGDSPAVERGEGAVLGTLEAGREVELLRGWERLCIGEGETPSPRTPPPSLRVTGGKGEGS